MKKSFAILFAALVIVMFGSCVKEGAGEEENASFTATVLAAEEDYLEVEPSEDSDERRSSDRISVSEQDALYFDAGGEEIDRPEFSEGQEIRIVYDGLIAESYPAQIHADEIHLTEAEG
ncbi:MAG TPA: DUF3221 domain-containing protein [Oscillospiraceae bacterium]|nr:DUF3221 domain-containing protein [Oscillospiraceae bacterium]HPW00239.1 DUF3221 domain-containing protein [Oscillospiraceae bacterium]